MADGKLSDKVSKKVDEFTELEDTPDIYAGNAGKLLKVTSDETGLEFEGTSRSYTIQGQGTPAVPLAGSQLLSQRLPITDSTTFSNLKDTSGYNGNSGKTVVVNANENGLTYSSGGGNESNSSIATTSTGTNAWVEGAENAPALGFWGFCLLPNNKVFMVPYFHSSTTCIFNPETNGFEDTVGAPPQNAFNGACLMGNGKVIMSPGSNGYAGTNIIYNPETNDFESISTAITGKTGGCVLLPNGKVFMIPSNNSSTALLYNPDTNSLENVGSSNTGVFMGGCLLPNGKVFMAPSGYAGTAMIYNPETNDYENTLSGSSGNTFYGAVLLPNGKVFCPPYNAQAGANGLKLIYNPETNNFESISGTRPSAGFGGGVLMTNGKVLLAAFGPSDIQIYNPETNELEAVSVKSPMGAFGQYGAVSLADGRCFSMGYGYGGKQYLFEPEGMGEIPYGDWMLEPYFNKF
jgi:hypothetical protein